MVFISGLHPKFDNADGKKSYHYFPNSPRKMNIYSFHLVRCVSAHVKWRCVQYVKRVFGAKQRRTFTIRNLFGKQNINYLAKSGSNALFSNEFIDGVNRMNRIASFERLQSVQSFQGNIFVFVSYRKNSRNLIEFGNKKEIHGKFAFSRSQINRSDPSIKM